MRTAAVALLLLHFTSDLDFSHLSMANPESLFRRQTSSLKIIKVKIEQEASSLATSLARDNITAS